VVFRVYENSGPIRNVYVNFGLVTTVNEGNTTNARKKLVGLKKK
jgi:hypothetical protein